MNEVIAWANHWKWESDYFNNALVCILFLQTTQEQNNCETRIYKQQLRQLFPTIQDQYK